MKIRIDALGDLHVQVDGQVSPELRGMRSRLALLIYLAVERDSNRDALKAILWPESDTTTARHALRQALYHIRGVVGDDWIDQAGDVIHATESLTSDVGDFQAALAAGEWEQVASLYRGPFLESIHLVSNHSWDAWVDRRRLTLGRDYRHACRQWVDERLAARNVEGALEAARIWVRPDPLDDEAQHRLIELLAVSGRRLEALDQYEIYTRLLESESLEPLEDTTRLAEDIRRGEIPQGAGHVVARAGLVTDAVPDPEGRHSATDEHGKHALPVGPVALVRRQRLQGPGRPARRTRRPILATLIILVLAAALIRMSGRSTGPVLEAGRTIVLPFANLTADSDLAGIGVLAADWTTQALTLSGVVEVISTDDMFRARVDISRDGTPEGDVADPLQVARSAHAATAVTGTFFVERDTIYFGAKVMDVSTGVVVRIVDVEPYAVEDLTVAVTALRDRIVGAMATLTDSRMKQWSDLASQPPDYRAYRHYATGLERFLAGADFDRSERAEREALRSEALDHFLAAADIDSTFTAALIWAWFAASGLPRLALQPCVDAGKCPIIPRLASAYERMPPWDRAMAEWVHAGPLVGPPRGYPARLEAGRKVARYAPDSEWLYKLAYAALPLNRPYEALAALDRIDPEQGWIRRWPAYWSQLAMALHQTRSHERELEVVEKFSTFQQDRAWPFLLDALAANHRNDELIDQVSSYMAESPPTWLAVSDINRAIRELRLHDADQTADRLAALALPWAARANLDEPGREIYGGQMQVRDELARLLIETGAYGEAQSLMMPVVFDVAEIPPWQFVATLGIAAAMAGDHALADRCVALLQKSSYAQGDPRNHLGQAQIRAAQGHADAALERLNLLIDLDADLVEANGLDDRWTTSGNWRWRPGGRDHWLELLTHPHRIAVLLRDEPRFQQLVEPRG